MILVGMGNPNQTLPLSAAALREVDILGTFRYANTYPEAIELLAKPSAELPDLSTLLTHIFGGLKNVESAFQAASKTHDEAGQLVLKVSVTQDPSSPRRELLDRSLHEFTMPKSRQLSRSARVVADLHRSSHREEKFNC